ncbi:hypothetical protein [Sneathia sanguinegens]|uniref:hypothetical protein n=1 Tax=Sneathia sanguinegens TaxID=40543 RepID=UPI002907C7FE|nr:hypothetical protein [Sneathia sanguinegens]MDU7497214.1 hypothetical protein [Sneathia sanguinegens]
MKKSLLLSTLILSLCSLANKTKGSIEFYNNNEHSFEKTENLFNIKNLGVKASITKNEFTIGANLKFKDLYPTYSNKIDAMYNFANNSKIYAKYEKSFGDTTPSLKISFNPDVQPDKNDKPILIGDIKVKGKVELKRDDINVGISSQTTFPFKNFDKIKDFPQGQLSYKDTVLSKHDLYLNGNTKHIKDIKAKLELCNSYSEPSHSLKYLLATLSANYSPINTLKLNLASNFKYQFNDYLDFEKQYTGTKRFINKIDIFSKNYNNGQGVYQQQASYFQSYNLGIDYSGLKKADFKFNTYVNHINSKAIFGINNALSYGNEFNATYMPIDNLTLSAYTHLGGMSLLSNASKINFGLFELNLGTKYDYKPIKQITLSPEFNVATYFGATRATLDFAKLMVAPALELTPKLAFNYSPLNKLNIKASVETPVTFTMLITDKLDYKFGFNNTNIKSAFNVKYEW